MDIEILPDSYLLSIASSYVPFDAKEQLAFAELARNAPDIYHLVYSPIYADITKEVRKKNNITMEVIIKSCLLHAGMSFDAELANKARASFTNQRVKSLEQRRI